MTGVRAQSRFGRRLVLGVFVVILLLWVGSIFLIPWAAWKFYGRSPCQEAQNVSTRATSAPSNKDGSAADASVGPIDRDVVVKDCLAEATSAYGTFGESFGAINALFSGLALAGVVLTLFFNSEASKRSAKPFVVPRLRREDADARVSIGLPVRAGAQVSLPVVLTVALHNPSATPALNVFASLTLDGVKEKTTASVDVPLTSTVEVCKFETKITGGEADAFVNSVCGLAGVKATLRVEYQSVEGIHWYCEVSYVLSSNKNRGEDERLLRDAINGQAGQNLWAAGGTVDLDFVAVSGSWIYGERV